MQHIWQSTEISAEFAQHAAEKWFAHSYACKERIRRKTIAEIFWNYANLNGSRRFESYSRHKTIRVRAIAILRHNG
jgi:hypothetical protein